MKREDLKALGLNDEQIEAVMASHGQAVQAVQGQVATLTTERDDYKAQAESRDKDLKKLQKDAKGNEELTKQMEELQAKYDTDTQALNEKIAAAAFDTALSEELAKTKARDPKDLKAFLNLTDIKLENGTFTGLSGQLETLQKDKPYLFNEGSQQSYDPAGGDKPKEKEVTKEQFNKMTSWERADFAQKDPEAFKTMTGGN